MMMATTNPYNNILKTPTNPYNNISMTPTTPTNPPTSLRRPDVLSSKVATNPYINI